MPATPGRARTKLLDLLGRAALVLDADGDVRPVEAGDEDPRLPAEQPLHDIVARSETSAVAVSATSGTCGNTSRSRPRPRYSPRKLWPHCEMQCASSMAMRLSGRRESADQHALGQQPLGGEIEQAHLARRDTAPRRDIILARTAGMDRLGADAFELERGDLVVHQRDERGDHDGEPAEHQRRQLVAQRLAGAGRHHRQRRHAGQHRIHHLSCWPGRKRSKPNTSFSTRRLAASRAAEISWGDVIWFMRRAIGTLSVTVSGI